jgi:hypothetical protein
MQPFLGVVNDKTLRHALSFGVGYIHDTQPAQERKVVDALFDMGAIQVCCWGGVLLKSRAIMCVTWGAAVEPLCAV